jgi:hypothetical protein
MTRLLLEGYEPGSLARGVPLARNRFGKPFVAKRHRADHCFAIFPIAGLLLCWR